MSFEVKSDCAFCNDSAEMLTTLPFAVVNPVATLLTLADKFVDVALAAEGVVKAALFLFTAVEVEVAVAVAAGAPGSGGSGCRVEKPASGCMCPGCKACLVIGRSLTHCL